MGWFGLGLQRREGNPAVVFGLYLHQLVLFGRQAFMERLQRLMQLRFLRGDEGFGILRELEPVHGQFKPRVIVLTAWGSPPAVLQAIGLGASAFMEKPLVPSSLLQAVQGVLSDDGGGDRAPGEAGVPIDWDGPLRE